MSYIMRTKGQTDNRNDDQRRSLNRRKREQELCRVRKENKTILERITKSEPWYQAQRWHEDWERIEKYRDAIRKYPRRWYNTPSGKQELIQKFSKGKSKTGPKKVTWKKDEDSEHKLAKEDNKAEERGDGGTDRAIVAC
ncbi:uncharacterized protein CFAP97D2 isoform X1 [Trichechus manatus latirostris]|uniref:Uncharacterized protein CFAP97D2 isoform X1 n=1 Tax=Trichechus manatus latirostris TaxID=127582 RepID=A0A2Y9R7G1_TRIMA|nr:uncharacterized protein CFAP97D2 isoform X1 [Trichechus manatus latirostris]